MPPVPIASFPADAELPLDVVVYGPDIPDESALRLLGNLDGQAGPRSSASREGTRRSPSPARAPT